MSPFSDLGLSEAFRGRRVLVTGHTGFKDSWLTLWLSDPHTTTLLERYGDSLNQRALSRRRTDRQTSRLFSWILADPAL